MNHIINYNITPIDPAGHLFEIDLDIQSPNINEQLLDLPTWIPGSYKIRDFSKNITQIKAFYYVKDNKDNITDNNYQLCSIPIVQTDKHTWAVYIHQHYINNININININTLFLKVIYRVYAYELSVRTAYLDERFGLINFSSLCLAVQGQKDVLCKVVLNPPVLNHSFNIGKHSPLWQVITNLSRDHTTDEHGFGAYYAINYDALIDYPVYLAPKDSIQWGECIVNDARHIIAIVGQVRSLDMLRLEGDITRLCQQHLDLFHLNRDQHSISTAPFLDSSTHYTFMIYAMGDGYGGLEHRASTALICKRSDLPSTLEINKNALSAGYQQFLGLVSHEYFHLWNVKRIKPAVFAPYHLNQETYTPLLWLFEGFTAYYDDLMLMRSKIITPQQYLNTLSKTITHVLRSPARLNQSLASASFNAWIQYYNPDENSPNVLCNYYTQGSLVALYLDLYIRINTHNHRSLDDVMRYLWQYYGQNFYKDIVNYQGVSLNDVFNAFHQSTGLELNELIVDLTEKAQTIPLQPLFNRLGVDWIQTQGDAANKTTASLGAIIKVQANNDVVLSTVYSNEAAHRAGLSGGDVLIALDGLKVTSNSLPMILSRIPAGTTVKAIAFRRDELIETEITLDITSCTDVQLHLNVDKNNTLQTAYF